MKRTTVEELIGWLNACPPKIPVVALYDCECAHGDISNFKVSLDPNSGEDTSALAVFLYVD